MRYEERVRLEYVGTGTVLSLGATAGLCGQKLEMGVVHY
jgi:hypothetical protein